MVELKIQVEVIMVEMGMQGEWIMHRSGDEDEDAEPENCAAPLTCKEKVSTEFFGIFFNKDIFWGRGLALICVNLMKLINLVELAV